MKDLESMIARTAVLRAEARAADAESRQAAKKAQEANDKYLKAQNELDNEIQERLEGVPVPNAR